MGQYVEVSLADDKTKHQFATPQEWQEVMNTDTDAAKIFNSLTPGNQRSLLYLVSRYKSVDKRIEQALKIAESLKAGITSARIIANGK